MQRYFCNTNEDTFTLNKDDSYHIIRVMRLDIGSKIETVINNELYISEITCIDNNIVTAKKINKVDINDKLPCRVTIVQALVKEQKFDYIIQKATELGVSEIIPLNTTRSIVKLNKNDDKKINRWKTIVKEASEQSKRTDIPNITGVQDINDLIKRDFNHKLICTVNEKEQSIKSVLQTIESNDTIVIVVGPEGGFEKSEEDLLIDNGFIPVSLGTRVLRTETASLFIMSIINYIYMG